MHQGNSRVVTLSVGGIEYQTTQRTLSVCPDSLLASIAQGNWQVDTKNRFFIDRDGELFAHILNFLRNNELLVPLDDPLLITKLLREAQFYQLQVLVDQLMVLKSKIDQASMTYKELLKVVNISRGPVQLPRCNFCLMQISFLDMTRANLQGCDFTGATLREVNLSYSNLSRAIFLDANLQNSSLREAVAERACFVNCNLSGVDMRRAMCRDCNFTKARLSGADLRFCDLQGCNLEEANFLVANLENTLLHFTNTKGTNFDRANLKDAQGLQSSHSSSTPL